MRQSVACNSFQELEVVANYIRSRLPVRFEFELAHHVRLKTKILQLLDNRIVKA